VLYHADVLDGLAAVPSHSVQSCVSSPPYYRQRDYRFLGQIGLEDTPEEYVDKLVLVARELKRVLTKDGVLIWNIGDTYASQGGDLNKRKADAIKNVGSKNILAVQGFAGGIRKPPSGYKPKDLIGVPWMVAKALQRDGWYLRRDIVWHKPNAIPEGAIKDRQHESHEMLFIFALTRKYKYDISKLEPEFRRTVWSIPTKGLGIKGFHIAPCPTALIDPCIIASTDVGDTVLDPFMGSGTVGVCALKLDRKFIGIDGKREYVDLADMRITRGA
jgi:site-specific DNA-methyltransferase (cytosine-N4-specific)